MNHADERCTPARDNGVGEPEAPRRKRERCRGAPGRYEGQARGRASRSATGPIEWPLAIKAQSGRRADAGTVARRGAARSTQDAGLQTSLRAASNAGFWGDA